MYFESETRFEYHNDPAKTKEAEHPDHSNWTTVGDIGYVDADGYLYLTDRATFMIISGGVNIYPQECENLLITHPKVADAAVFGVPNEDFGEEVKAVLLRPELLDHDVREAGQLALPVRGERLRQDGRQQHHVGVHLVEDCHQALADGGRGALVLERPLQRADGGVILGEVDPDTGVVQEIKVGARGELVYTSIDRECILPPPRLVSSSISS